MISALLLLLGAIVGSFLNVVGLRWETGRSIGGRSSCPNCGKTLSWYELVPLLSFIWLKGKCSVCGAKISWQYPIVELWTGLVFLSLYNLLGLNWFFLLVTVVFCLYIVITIYDSLYKIIPDELVYSSIALGLAVPLFFVHFSLIDWLAGPILFTFFGSIWFFSGGRAMGFGDAKLGLSVGLLLGAAQGFSAIVLAFWLGALSSLIYVSIEKFGFLKTSKGLTMKSEVPFAPFIILGAWLALIFNFNLLNVVL